MLGVVICPASSLCLLALRSALIFPPLYQPLTVASPRCPSQTLSELKTATVCSVSFGDMTGLVDGQLVTLVSWEEKEMAPYVGDIIAPSALDCPDLESLSCGQEFCHQKLVEGEADIWMEDALALNVYQQVRF